MDSQAFRRLALSLPESEERAHGGHPDFRVRAKVFASLNAAETEGNLKLEPGRQQALIRLRPGVFSAHNGAWGRPGLDPHRPRDGRSGGRAARRSGSRGAWSRRRNSAAGHPEDGPRLRLARPDEIE